MTNRETASFYYLSSSGAHKTRFAPNTACDGQGFRNIKTERLNESGSDGSIEVTVVLPEE
jgi:hypothetical protein